MALFWLIVFVVSLGAVAIVAWPIAAGGGGESGAADSTGADEAAQMASAIERDRDYGLIDEDAAKEAEREARSKADMNDEQQTSQSTSGAGVSRRARFAAFLALGAAPLAAVLLYLNLGSPQALNAKTQVANTAAPAQAAATNQQITGLEAQLRKTPDDFEGWMTLGEDYITANRPDDAVRAFSEATKLKPEDAGAVGSYGEALVQQAGGTVTGEAEAAFKKAAKLAPEDPRARYYLAEARYQVGAVKEAVSDWVALLNEAPVGAPWFAAVAARMADAAAEAGVKQEDLGLSKAAAARIASAKNAAPSSSAGDDLNAMVGRIHDGSASYEDWMNAAAIYSERGDTERAKTLLEQAKKRYEGAPFVLAQIEKAETQLAAGKPIATSAAPAVGPANGGGSGGVKGPTDAQVAAISAMPEGQQRQMIEGMVKGLAEKLKREPDNPEGWRMLGRSYRVLGQPKDSEKAWRELLSRESGNPEDWRGLAFALMDQRPKGDNTVSPELESVLKKLREFNPDDPLALYNLGYAAKNRGDTKQALELWTRLKDKLPPDTPLMPTLEKLIADAKAS